MGQCASMSKNGKALHCWGQPKTLDDNASIISEPHTCSRTGSYVSTLLDDHIPTCRKELTVDGIDCSDYLETDLDLSLAGDVKQQDEKLSTMIFQQDFDNMAPAVCKACEKIRRLAQVEKVVYKNSPKKQTPIFQNSPKYGRATIDHNEIVLRDADRETTGQTITASDITPTNNEIDDEHS